jgi:hypothetical protein
VKEPRRIVLHAGGQAEAYASDARFKVIAAGRRWGKTEMALAQLLTACLLTNGVYRYIAPTQKLARKTLWRRKLKRVLDPSWLAKPPNETNLEVWFKTGSILEVVGADDPDSLRGEGVSGAVLDEYADMAEETWPEAVRPSLADMRGWGLFIGTPKSFNHFHEVFERGHSDEHPKWAAWSFKSLDNPLLDPDEVEEARRTTDPRTFRQEWEASFEALKGRAYYAFNRSTHVRPVELIRGLPACVMFDFNINPATATVGQFQGEEVRAWREVWITDAGGEATRAAATAARQLLRDIGWIGEIRVYGDATGRAGKTTGPSDHEVLKDVFPGATWCIPKAQPHVKDRVAAVNSRFETMDGRHHAVIDPACKRLIADCEQVVFSDNGELDQRSNPQLTHSSSGWGYFVHREFPPVPKLKAVATIRADTSWQRSKW